MDDFADLITTDHDPPRAVIRKLVRLDALTTPEDVLWRRVPRVEGMQPTTCECGRFVRLFGLDATWLISATVGSAGRSRGGESR